MGLELMALSSALFDKRKQPVPKKCCMEYTGCAAFIFALESTCLGLVNEQSHAAPNISIESMISQI